MSGPDPAALDAVIGAPSPRRRAPLFATFAAALFSLGGNAIALVAIPIIALQQTGSPLAAGVVGVFATVPLVIGGAFGGVLVDRFGYRASSIVADLASAVTVLALPILHATVGLEFAVMLALVFLGGLLDPPGDTAKTALTPDLAALARMPIARAAGIQSAVQRTATMLGAATAGALIAFLGPMPALLVDAAGFVISAALVLLFVPRGLRAASAGAGSGSAGRAGESGPAADDDGAGSRGFVAGLRFVARSPLLRAIVLLVTLTNAIDAAGMMVLKPLYATEVLGDPALLGFMVGCFAGGALLGSTVFAAVGHRWSGRVLFAACFMLAGTVPYAAMALGAPAPVLLPVLAVSGFAAGAINPMIATAMYGLIPDGMRARVFGVTTAGVTATMPLGAFLGGLAAEQFGVVGTMAGCAALYLVLASSPLSLRAFGGLRAANARAAASDG
ncbi:MFS transporter [Agromyces sp. NBRC 114283]|uniref:MFS transporter n=1 Tax=Agromyces sp. NBRC 114283 TaxID=2994521 RepID=UPI0024A45897|nr:MFS transporter [Agromyces sp. NBRC 114283]GLU89324.1 MFS transporter [Agromyces sp. NBRC 114283]